MESYPLVGHVEIEINDMSDPVMASLFCVIGVESSHKGSVLQRVEDELCRLRPILQGTNMHGIVPASDLQ